MRAGERRRKAEQAEAGKACERERKREGGHCIRGENKKKRWGGGRKWEECWGEEVCVSRERDSKHAEKKKKSIQVTPNKLESVRSVCASEMSSNSGERRPIICTDKWKSEQRVRVCRGPRRCFLLIWRIL